MSGPRDAERSDDPPGRTARSGSATLAAGIALLAFLTTAAWSAAQKREDSFEGRRKDLAKLVAARQERAAALEADLRQLRAEVERLGASAAHGELARLRQARERLARAAGLTTVSGPGLVVKLSDSALARRGEPRSADFQIQDLDVQAVVNELWQAGAEAIAVNEQRVVATTAIRNAGGAVLVNYEVLTSPYRVVAIGDPDRLRQRFARSHIAEQLRRWSEVYRLGFSVSEQRDLVAPAFVGSLQFRYARPAPEPGEAPSPAP